MSEDAAPAFITVPEGSRAGVAFSMHHADIVDLDFILSGAVDLILDDGEHPLRAGDSAVVTGVDHA